MFKQAEIFKTSFLNAYRHFLKSSLIFSVKYQTTSSEDNRSYKVLRTYWGGNEQTNC